MSRSAALFGKAWVVPGFWETGMEINMDEGKLGWRDSGKMRDFEKLRVEIPGHPGFLDSGNRD